MKKFISIVMPVLMVMVLVACGGNSNQNNSATATNTGANSMTKAEFEQIIDASCGKTFASNGCSYKISWDGDTMVISTCTDGITEALFYAMCGNQDAESAWFSMVSAQENLSQQILDKAIHNGLDIHVQINLLNDKNTDNVLLSVLDGSTIYNAIVD